MFSAEYNLDYRGVRPDLTITFPRYLEYMQETSLRHTQSTNYPMEWYAENHKGFLLANWQVNICKYPCWNERIIIQTWPLYFKGVLAERVFVVRDHKNAIIALANSRWCYTDLEKHKPIRPPKELVEGYGDVGPSELVQDYKLKDLDTFTKINEHKLLVTRRDIDSNNHVNNVKYIEWALDYVPDELYEQRQVVNMKTAYRGECKQGDEVLVETWAEPSNSNTAGVEIISIIRDSEDMDTVLTEIYTQWE